MASYMDINWHEGALWGVGKPYMGVLFLLLFLLFTQIITFIDVNWLLIRACSLVFWVTDCWYVSMGWWWSAETWIRISLSCNRHPDQLVAPFLNWVLCLPHACCRVLLHIPLQTVLPVPKMLHLSWNLILSMGASWLDLTIINLLSLAMNASVLNGLSFFWGSALL